MKRVKKTITWTLIVAVVGAVFYLYMIELLKAETVYEAEPVPDCDLMCLVDKRTGEIYERDHKEYMEDARLKAMLELNEELGSMTYDSPYIHLNE